MRALDYVRSVRHTLSSNRLRAFLTLLGTIIGSASIVLLAGLLRSGEELLVYSSQRASEADLVEVRKDLASSNTFQRTRRELGRIDDEMVESSPLLDGAQASSESSRELPAQPVTDPGEPSPIERELRVRLVSAAPDTPSLYRLEVAQGRGLNADDLLQRRRVCVVGSDVWRRLFGADTKLGSQRLRIQDHQWAIVGVLKNKRVFGGGDGTWMWNRKALTPETTFDAMFRPSHEVDVMYVRLKSSRELAARVGVVEKLLKQMLLRSHNVENFSVKGQNSSEGQERLILQIIKGLLLSTALISLFVGGINIMNIMLVTVTERTREIGVRRAIGATPRQISMQFLLEAGFIASVGGLIGVASGVVLTWLTSHMIGKSVGSFAFHIETWSVLLGLGLSLSTGIAFGLFPALRASRLDPVEALRFE